MKTVKFNEGTEGAAQAKVVKRFKIGMAIVTILFFLITYAGLFHLNPYYWHLKAGSIAGIFGVLIYAGMLACLWFADWLEYVSGKDWMFYLLWFILLGLSFCVPAGFNFSL